MKESFLTKNIRPIILLFFLFIWLLIVVLSLFDSFSIDKYIVDNIKEITLFILPAYIASRGVEKVVKVIKGGVI